MIYQKADAFGSLGQLESSFIKLSCVQCNLSEAKAKVITGYHICTDLELFSGGFQVIRILGWVSFLFLKFKKIE